MIGSIIGDIVGSIYEVEEVNAIKTREDKKSKYFNDRNWFKYQKRTVVGGRIVRNSSRR